MPKQFRILMWAGRTLGKAQEDLPFTRQAAPEAGVLLEGSIVHSLPIVGQVAVVEPQNALPQPLCHLQAHASVTSSGSHQQHDVIGQMRAESGCLDVAVLIKMGSSL